MKSFFRNNSLSIIFFALFIVTLFLQSITGFKQSAIEYLGNSKLWFESFENWQSEFLSVVSIVILSIYFRQKNSPQSKPVDAPNYQTGEG